VYILWAECGRGLLGYVANMLWSRSFDPSDFTNDGYMQQCFGLKNEDLLNIVIKLFTLGIFCAKALSLLVAVLVYIPLVFRIKGNLKEYCVHKIDKR
jgi:hypothetical protein